jgi:hypothetical protein
MLDGQIVFMAGKDCSMRINRSTLKLYPTKKKNVWEQCCGLCVVQSVQFHVTMTCGHHYVFDMLLPCSVSSSPRYPLHQPNSLTAKVNDIKNIHIFFSERGFKGMNDLGGMEEFYVLVLCMCAYNTIKNSCKDEIDNYYI